VNGVVSEKHGDAVHKKRQERLRWVLILLLSPLSIYLCGQLAWLGRAPPDEVEIHSSLTADYSPWTAAFFPSLDPNILMAALQDRREGGLSDAGRAMNCFLLSSGCEMVSQADTQVMQATPMPLRIANNVEPDLTQPDGEGLLLSPGKEIVLDLRDTPILVSGTDEPQAEVFIYILQDPDQKDGDDLLEISIAMQQTDAWIPVFTRGDQPHGDIMLKLPYSTNNEIRGENQTPFISSEDAFLQDGFGFGLDVDASVAEPGLYNWLRIGIINEADHAVALDAIVVVDDVE
jgi:hypothetical protein